MQKEDAIRELKALLERRAPWEEFESKRKAESKMIFAVVATETANWECLVIKHSDGYELLESQPNYAAIADSQWWVEEEYFVLEPRAKQYTLVPASIQTIAPTFGNLPAAETDTVDRGTYKIQREVYFPTERQRVQLDLPFPSDEDGLSLIEQRLRSLKDPLALKIVYAALQQCQKSGGPAFYYYPNRIAEILGYKCDQRGYHQTHNILRIEKKFELLLNATYTYTMPWGKLTLKHEGPLLEIGKATMSLIKKDRVLAKAVQINFNHEIYKEISEHKRFSIIDNRCLAINTQKHGRAFLFYSYYSNQMSLGLREHGRKIRQKLRTILKRSGVSLGAHKARDMGAIQNEHDYLVSEGLVTSWQILDDSEASQDALESIWEIVMPADHPAWVYWKEKNIQVRE